MRPKRKTKKDYAEEIAMANPHVTENRRLAKILCAKYPLLFPDLESARKIVRVAMGAHGESSRKRINKPFAERLAKLRIECEVEDGSPPDVTPYTFRKDIKKLLVISDAHHPYQDMKAIDIALEYGYNKGVDAVCINGDWLDFNTISRYLSKPDEMRMLDVIELGKKTINYISQAMSCKLVFHEGNHDIRCEQYLMRQAPEFWGLPSVELKNLLDCDKHNIDYVSNIKTMHFGKLVICHGNHIVKGVFSPVNPARGAFTKANSSIMIGHCHRTSTHVESDIKGKVTGSFSIGCLTTLNPEYNPQVSKHNLGFAVVELNSNEGDFIVDNKMIIENKVR